MKLWKLNKRNTFGVDSSINRFLFGRWRYHQAIDVRHKRKTVMVASKPEAQESLLLGGSLECLNEEISEEKKKKKVRQPGDTGYLICYWNRLSELCPISYFKTNVKEGPKCLTPIRDCVVTLASHAMHTNWNEMAIRKLYFYRATSLFYPFANHRPLDVDPPGSSSDLLFHVDGNAQKNPK